MAHGQPYYGAFLQLQDKLCTVVGGGEVARRKIEKLLSRGAKVRVVSPELHADIANLAGEGKVDWVPRAYAVGDIGDSWLIFATTNSRQVNQLVRQEAEAAGRFVNVADSRDACTLIVPALLHFGAVQLAISTSGTDPSTAKRLRTMLEEDLANGTRRFQEELLRHL